MGDLASLPMPETQWRPLIEKTIAGWEERDRFVDECEGQFVIDVKMLRSWNCSDYRFHPVKALREALEAYDLAKRGG